jgi:heme a synthase
MSIWAWAFLSGRRFSVNMKIWSTALMAVVLLQYLLGVFTLLYHVPISLGVIHQAVAMIMFGITIGMIHRTHVEMKLA